VQASECTLTGGEPQTDTDRGAILRAAIGRAVHNQFIGPEAAVQSMQALGFPPTLAEGMDSLNRLVAASYATAVSPKVRNILGRAPRTFAAFAAEHAAVWR
jgi:(4-alkanoyl-5-oxo-2,5-dihydrofuran-3-yl)methyl phosphate reductase